MTAQSPVEAVAAMHEMLMAVPVDEIELGAINALSEFQHYNPNDPLHVLRIMLFNLVRQYQVEYEQPQFSETWRTNVLWLEEIARLLHVGKFTRTGKGIFIT